MRVGVTGANSMLGRDLAPVKNVEESNQWSHF